MPTIEEIEKRFYQYAEEFALEQFPAKHREHLGVSEIGEECSRLIWFKFRWVKLIEFIPRMRRLFNRGHLQEPYFEKFLSWSGVWQRSIDPATDKQFKFSKVSGHYGGSNDGIGLISWADNLRILTEFKTHNDKNFNNLKKEKVVKAFPKHYAQMCGYGREWQLEWALYCAVNKDDEEWYFEMVKLDWQYAEQLEKKASDIIFAKFPPPKIAENSSYYKCKYCDYADICHNGAAVEKNCRSCKMSSPVENGQWFCSRWNSIIPEEHIINGCGDHISII